MILPCFINRILLNSVEMKEQIIISMAACVSKLVNIGNWNCKYWILELNITFSCCKDEMTSCWANSMGKLSPVPILHCNILAMQLSSHLLCCCSWGTLSRSIGSSVAITEAAPVWATYCTVNALWRGCSESSNSLQIN